MDYNFLNDRFVWNKTHDVYVSKQKWIGSGTGDDSLLYMDVSGKTTQIWWKQNRGYETTIFDGRKLTTPEEFESLFDFLELRTYLKWDKMVEIDVNPKPKPADFADYKDYMKAYCAWERKANPEVNIKPKPTVAEPYMTPEKGVLIDRMVKLGIATKGQTFEQMVSSALQMLEVRQLTDSYKDKKPHNQCSCGRGEKEAGEYYCKQCLKANPMLCA